MFFVFSFVVLRYNLENDDYVITANIHLVFLACWTQSINIMATRDRLRSRALTRRILVKPGPTRTVLKAVPSILLVLMGMITNGAILTESCIQSLSCCRVAISQPIVETMVTQARQRTSRERMMLCCLMDLSLFSFASVPRYAVRFCKPESGHVSTCKAKSMVQISPQLWI